MAEPMNGDFRKLLDEQKKSNELLSSINTGQQEQGTAKEIIKQALPEIANERQLHKQRMKFEKKTGKTEVDDKVEKQTKTIEKLEKATQLDYRTYAKEINNFIKEQKTSLSKYIKDAQNFNKVEKTRVKAQNRLLKAFQKSSEGQKKQIDIAESNLAIRRKEIEQRGGNVEKDALYKAEMLAIEKRKQRLERRNASGLAARSLATFKNIKTITQDFIAVKLSLKGIASGIFGLTKGLFKGTGRVLGAGLSLGKKFALLAFLPALLAFLNSDTFEKMKVFLSENLLPAIEIFNERVLQPVKNFLINVFFKTFENVKTAIGDKNTPNTLAYAFDQFKQGNIIEGVKSSIMALYNLFKNTVSDMFDSLLHDVLKPMFKLDIKDDDTFFGLIGGFFTKMLDTIKGFFSLETFAGFYDRLQKASGGFLPEFNPFRAAIKIRDDKFTKREDEMYGGGEKMLDINRQLELIREQKLTRRQIAEMFDVDFPKANELFLQSKYGFIPSSNTSLNTSVSRTEIETLPFGRFGYSVIDLIDYFKKENQKVKDNAGLLIQSIRNENLIKKTGRFGAFDSAVDLQMALKSETAAMLSRMSKEEVRAFILKDLGITTNTDGSALVVSGSGNTEINNETYEVHTKNIKSSDSHQSLSSDLN